MVRFNPARARAAGRSLACRALIIAGLQLAAAGSAHAAVQGVLGPNFDLVAAPTLSSQPDGAQIYSWGYGCASGGASLQSWGGAGPRPRAAARSCQDRRSS
ncbi:hypothetical protein ACPWT1_14865 [Ramlibacter sp. MMS24-I3-19]|uniref:hypothetical protein n=1 Tax=Ramlibacter sp. MMS24-I3-19 TaxID=3416606 RepID=UPI003D08974E